MSVKFSIIIPAFNNAETIEEAINSALLQEYENFEIVVSDNASTDGTCDVLKKYNGNTKIRVFLHHDFYDKTANWNRAYALADPSSVYYVNLHADDILNPQLLEILSLYINKYPGVGLIFGGHKSIKYGGEEIFSSVFPFKWKAKGLMAKYIQTLNNTISVVGTCIRKDLFIKVGGWPEKYNHYNDVDFFYSLIRSDTTLLSINKVFGSYRELKNTTDKWLQNALREQIIWYGNLRMLEKNIFIQLICAVKIKHAYSELFLHDSEVANEVVKPYGINQKIFFPSGLLIKLQRVLKFISLTY